MPSASTTRMKIKHHTITSPRDPQSGLPTGQRMHKPFVPSSAPSSSATGATDTAKRPGNPKPGKLTMHREFSGKDTFQPAKAPRDVATGQASGKRQHGPITIFNESGTTTPAPPPPPEKK